MKLAATTALALISGIKPETWHMSNGLDWVPSEIQSGMPGQVQYDAYADDFIQPEYIVFMVNPKGPEMNATMLRISDDYLCIYKGVRISGIEAIGDGCCSSTSVCNTRGSSSFGWRAIIDQDPSSSPSSSATPSPSMQPVKSSDDFNKTAFYTQLGLGLPITAAVITLLALILRKLNQRPGYMPLQKSANEHRDNIEMTSVEPDSKTLTFFPTSSKGNSSSAQLLP